MSDIPAQEYKIGQQIYTRERKGLFRASEGYDSAAKSANLTDAFVKDSLHPYCVYTPSRKLQSENAPPEAYPPAYTVARYPDGRTLVGRSVYLPADFTGQRSTFFTHNYVLPPGYEVTPGMLLNVSFISGYDIALGTELPELEELPVNEQPESNPAINLSQPQFTKLLSFIFQSAYASGTKKIYLQVPVRSEDTSRCAINLLDALFACLPEFMSRRLGFLTYAREPENKKGLNLIFLEKDSLRPGDPRISRDFFMDMSRDGDAEDSPYARFVWENMARPDALTSFYNFASAFKEELTLTHWDNLLTVYEVVRENGLQNESGVFTAASRSFLNRVRERPDTARYLAALARCVETGLFSAYINFLIDNNEPERFLGYAGDCINFAPAPAALFAEVRFWLESVPAVPELPAFADLVCQKAGAFLDEAHDPIAVSKILYGHVKDFFAEGYKLLTLRMGEVIEEHLTPRLDFDSLTRAQLLAVPPAYICRGKAGNNPAPYLMLEILRKISLSLDAGTEIDLRRFLGSYRLPETEATLIRNKLKEFYAGYADKAHFKSLAALMEGAELLTFVNANYPDTAARAEFICWALNAGEIKPGNPRHWEAVKGFVKSNMKDGAFKERIYQNQALKDLTRELRFGKLAGILK